MKISTLRTYAREAAKFRGHIMDRFQGRITWQISVCVICRMEMEVKTDPQQNEIFVSGEAIALCCPIKNKEDK